MSSFGWIERESTYGRSRACDYGPFTLVVRPQPHSNDWSVVVEPGTRTRGPSALLAPKVVRCDAVDEAAVQARVLLAARLRALADLVENT